MDSDHFRANDGETSSQTSTTAVKEMIKVLEQLRVHRQSDHLSNAHTPTWYDTKNTIIHRKYLIEQLKNADNCLHNILNNDQLEPKILNEFNEQRNNIKTIFINLIKSEMKFCRQHNVEQHFWKILYYNFIETIRRLMSKCDKLLDIHQYYCITCMHFIDDGLNYFDQLLSISSQTYNFQIDDFLNANGGRNLRGMKYVSLAIVSTQKFCMYIGDLLRYREQINDTTNYDKAMEWYVKAYQLIPSNGMPSNQIAILSLYNKRKFDAIFYHMRSLNASNPIKSAKESLVILFDELRKKYQLLEAKREKRGKQKNRKCSAYEENFRREIWVHPKDGQLNYRTVFLDDETDESLDTNDLYKKFILHFSHLHGIIFTRVAAETLEKCMQQTLKLFQELLNHRSSGIFTNHKMTQMFVMNAYAIENCSRDKSSLLVPAIIFMFTFVSIVLSKIQDDLGEAIQLLEKTDETNLFRINGIEKFQLSDNVDTSLTVLSLWSKWANTNRSLWSTLTVLSAVHQFGDTFQLCIWNEIARTTTMLGAIDFSVANNKFVTICSNDVHRVDDLIKFRLPEELITLGTSYLLEANNLFCNNASYVRNACSFIRLKNFYEFCADTLIEGDGATLKKLNEREFISANICNANNELFHSANNESTELPSTKTSNENPPNESHSMCSHDKSDASLFDDKKAALKSLQKTDFVVPEPTAVASTSTAPMASSSTSITATDSSSAVHSSSDEIQKLLQRKIELEQSHKMHEQLNRFTQEILRQDNADIVCIEIRPKYLVPDTNCYIDFLDEIKQLVSMYPVYHVILPIVVLNELEGLAKGDSSGTKQYDTPTKTSLQAHKALVLLKNVGNAVKCTTTRGSFLNSMTFTKETDASNANEYLNNDDKILLTVTNLTEIHSKNSIEKQQHQQQCKPSTNLQRKVVLLTNDRNLKLKAIAQNIPVRELIDFIKWSAIGK